ncbi:pantoate--beta-alanine ligase [Sphingomonas prati]|uniref:Pantothenate synthetase n=1 Tax=Sphingomonas prati TaxID=1843237 RepID=A0A7W9BSA2_9SPHN|nr:pantoate--beta-alanine ligase [Sphingomonas prati]MBB5729180.1 pantoate--beta-alanine ligase [Sphingomonas prati]GGE84479.1 pantothenate synthetase [Sphingomonas prati]
MQIIRTVGALRAIVRAWRAAGESVALVPTMGALHAGHMALVAAARLRADHVVASIFVNPTQFGPNEDLVAYPRREAADAAMLDAGGVDVLWAPDVAAMYPEGYASNLSVAGVSEGLCGAARPGHFDGVATVVAKLLNQVQPDVALFGEKDWQQLAVIRRMVADMDFAVEIVGVPTQREDDGLALSSRNAYLDDEQRAAARAMPRALGEAAAAIARGDDVAGVLAAAERRLIDAGFASVDYVALSDAESLVPVGVVGDRPMRLLAAARLGTTRLIDNVPVVVG